MGLPYVDGRAGWISVSVFMKLLRGLGSEAGLRRNLKRRPSPARRRVEAK